MPRVEDFEALAPFTVDELVSAANAILRDRPALLIQARTVRYYISEGILPSPSGGPKFARYQIEHLRRIVAVRFWIDEGLSLDQCRRKLEAREHDLPLELPVHGGRQAIHSPPQRVSAPLNEQLQSYAPEAGEFVRKVRLTPFSVLEIDSSARWDEELLAIQQAVRRLRSQGIQ